jgi:PAS domain S-box-containing protein
MPTNIFPAAAPGTPIPSAKGDMLRLINDFDWASTPVGPMSQWPDALPVTVRIMLASPVPMVMLMGENGVLVYNDAYAVFAGNRHPDILGMKAAEAWPEIADFNNEILGRVLTGESISLPDQMLRLNRTGAFEDVWMDLEYSPVLDSAGRPVAELVIAYETTKSVVAQRALATSEERLQLALTASGIVGTWDWDLKSGLVTADERFAEMFGVDPEAAASGIAIGDYEKAVHPDDRAYVRDKIAESLDERTEYNAEYRLQPGGGGVRWILATGHVITDANGQPVRLPGVVIDISERKASEAALASSEAKFRAIADTMPQMVWSTLPDGFHDYYNARWYEFTGVPYGSTDGEAWNGMFHPEDQERAWASWKHSLETGEPYQIEYRLRHHSGEYRWTLGRALPIHDEKGRIIRWFGTCTDIHDTKRAAEEREIVAQELSHRIKNLFSVLTGIIGLSSRTYPEVKPFADQLRQRIQAMGQAHDFVRPHSGASRPPANPSSLKALIEKLLAPHKADDALRVVFEGPDAVVDDAAATPIALLFHELVTNAAKYGSLSRPGGLVRIETSEDGETYRMTWREEGGDPDLVAPVNAGFGTRLITLSVEGQLKGTIERHWEPGGLRVELTIPLTSLNRSSKLGRIAAE